MVRMREPQRLPLGTRVANPLEGRTGQISAFDADTGLYTLQYSDGHTDALPFAQADTFVIKKSAEEQAKEDEQKAKDKANDPHQFLGATVTKSSTSYEGKTLTSSGQVTQYFADIRRFRVLFSDGLYSDMTLEEVKQNLKSGDKKRPADDAAESPASKKSRQHKEERPLNAQKFESRETAYAICKQVLGIILNQKALAKTVSEKQKVILNNTDLKPKRALMNFVDADGLHTLERVLGAWFRSEARRLASMLVLKVLAMLPGVKEEHLRKTTIARTLRTIEKTSQAASDVDVVYGDLARWIIQKWARTAMKRTFNPSARDLLLQQQAEISRAGSEASTMLRASSRPSAKLTPQQKETVRLETLRKSDDVVAEDPGDEVVVVLPQFNSLGSEDMRRPVRQTQFLEPLAAKINRDYEDSLKKHSDNADEEEDDGVTQGRIVFGKPQLMQFSQHVPVVDLFATTRSKIVDSNGGSSAGAAVSSAEADSNAPPTPLPRPNKTREPKKSILKVRDEVITPASQVSW